MTQWGKREAQRIQKWTELDANYAVGQFRLKFHGWTTERRFVVIGERVRESRASVGRKLIDVPGYKFRIFVTNRNDAPEEIWRDYNRRADMENRIVELKHDLGANHFCLSQFQPPRRPFALCCSCSTCRLDSNAPPACQAIANRARSGADPDLWCDRGPVSPPPRRPHRRKLGRSEDEPLLASILQWQIPTLAEVNSRHAMLTPSRPAGPVVERPQVALGGDRLRN